MAGSKRPSFLKRQKEQKRLAKAKAKREARLERKDSPGGSIDDVEQMEPLTEPNPELLEELLGPSAPLVADSGGDDDEDEPQGKPAGRG